MAKTKAVAEAKERAGPAPTGKRPTLQPAKASGPQQLQRAMMTATGGAAAMTAAGGAPGRARTMGALQRTLGNARMARMASPAPTAGVAGANGKMRPIQTKLTVGPANDPFEREADAAAGRITAGQPVGRISRLPAAGLAAARRKCSACGKEMEERPPGPVQRKCSACQEEEEAQRQPAGTAGGEPSLDTEGAERAMSRSGPGSPLAPAMRTTMEKGFGADFSGVRVHTGPAADEASRAVNARAFTRGSDIYLARGESASDHRLMGHELAHTIQQGGLRPIGRLQRRGNLEPSAGEIAADVVQPPATLITPSSAGYSIGGGAGAVVVTPEEGIEEEAAGVSETRGADDEEEIEIPSFGTGEEGGCPQLVEQESLLPGGGEAAHGEALGGAAGEGHAKGGEGSTERGVGGPGETSTARAPAAAPGTEEAGPFAQLLNIAAAVVPGGGLLASASGLLGASALQLWRRLPLVARAAAITHAIGLAISGAAFLPRVRFDLFGLWIRAGIIAFLKRLQGLADNLKVTLFEKYLSICFGQNAAFNWGYLKGLFEGFFVDGLLGIVQMIIDIVCLIGKIPQAINALARFFGAFPEQMQRFAEAIVRLGGAMRGATANIVGEVRAMFRDPSRVVGVVTAVSGAAEAVGRRIGETMADVLISVMGQPAERIGKSAGRIGGMILFEVVLALLTSGGGVAVTVAKTIARGAVKVFAMIGQRLLAVGRFIMGAIRTILPFVRQAARSLTRFFRGVADQVGEALQAIVDFFAEILRRCRRTGSWRCRVPRRERRRPRRRQRARAREIEWTNNPRSREYGHSVSEHGPRARTDEGMLSTARQTGVPQGRFFNEQSIVDAERATRGRATGWIQEGHYIQEVEIRNVGEVFMPDGVTRVVTHRVRVIREGANPYGRVITSYPVLTRTLRNRLRRRR